MRSLEINKRKIFYAQQVGTEEVGEYDETKAIYSDPQSLDIKVEYVNSSVSIVEYGRVVKCDVKLSTSKTSYPFNDKTVFWIDTPTSNPHDYVMAEVPKKSINGVVYYLKKVEVSNA